MNRVREGCFEKANYILDTVRTCFVSRIQHEEVLLPVCFSRGEVGQYRPRGADYHLQPIQHRFDIQHGLPCQHSVFSRFLFVMDPPYSLSPQLLFLAGTLQLPTPCAVLVSLGANSSKFRAVCETTAVSGEGIVQEGVILVRL